jgi:hypothetical protein
MPFAGAGGCGGESDRSGQGLARAGAPRSPPKRAQPQWAAKGRETVPHRPARHIRTAAATALGDMPVVVLTSEHDALHRLRMLGRGGDDLIAKPLSYPELLARALGQGKTQLGALGEPVGGRSPGSQSGSCRTPLDATPVIEPTEGRADATPTVPPPAQCGRSTRRRSVFDHRARRGEAPVKPCRWLPTSHVRCARWRN